MKTKILLACAVIVVLAIVGVAALLYYVLHRAKGQSFDSDGVSIHYTDEGSGEPVILVHGFLANGDLNWRKPGIIKALVKEFRVITMDLRGHGLSGKPHDPAKYGMEMVKDIVRLMDHLHIEKAHVVGYSLGGALTLKLAATYPDRLLTACPLGAGWEKPGNSEFLTALDRFATQLEAGKGITPLIGAFGGDRPKPGRLHYVQTWILTKYLNDPLALVGVLKGIPAIGLTEDEVRNIRVPVCSIVGGNDPLKVGVDNMRGLVKDQTITIVEGADHVRTPLRPEFRDALRNFLRAHSEK